MPVFVFASGFKLADFGRPQDPLAVALDILPLEKERIISENKQMIHSLKKGIRGETEEELRAYFKGFRQ